MTSETPQPTPLDIVMTGFEEFIDGHETGRKLADIFRDIVSPSFIGGEEDSKFHNYFGISCRAKDMVDGESPWIKLGARHSRRNNSTKDLIFSFELSGRDSSQNVLSITFGEPKGDKIRLEIDESDLTPQLNLYAANLLVRVLQTME